MSDVHIEDALEAIIEEGAQANEAPPATAAAPTEALSETRPEAAVESDRILDEIQEYSGEEINSQVVFRQEGLSAKERRRQSPAYKRRLAEAARFYKDLKNGRVGYPQLAEAMTTADFPILLGDTVDRILLAEFSQYNPTFRSFCRRRAVRDFRSVRSVRLSGGERLHQVPERGNYQQDALGEEYYTFSVKKYGKTFPITMEMMVNDDLEAFSTLPQRMARAAIQTEMATVSALYVANSTMFATDHTGPDGNTYSNKGTAPLTLDNLETAWKTMTAFPGDEDIPLMNSPAFLVIPPLLEITARRVLGPLAPSVGDVTAPYGPILVGYTNVLGDGRLTVVIDPYIPFLDPTNGNTSWYLFSNPAEIPVVEYGYIRGYEQPQVFSRVPNSMRMGGGLDMVDFDTDSMDYKVRHVVGGSHTYAVGGWRGAYWSDGSA